MAQSNYYTRVGVFTTIILLICFLGFSFIKGNITLGDHTKLYILSEDASGLSQGTPIVFRGLKIGQVKDLSIINNKVLIELLIEDEMRFSKSAEFEVNNSLLGDRTINVKNLDYSNDYYQSGDTLNLSLTYPSMTNLIDSTMMVDIEPSLKEISNIIGTALINYSNSIDTTAIDTTNNQ